jgi:triosephosphate isomerase
MKGSKALSLTAAGGGTRTARAARCPWRFCALVAISAGMRQLIAGNWKMNLLRQPAVALAQAVAAGAASLACDLLVCPPFTALDAVAGVLRGSPVGLGAQDCHQAASGAYTGDVAAPMLADAGCQAVIVGHSERRQYHQEGSLLVRQKAEAAAAAGLVPIICVGETEAERDAGAAEALVCVQVAESVPEGFTGSLAYEPVWAIGTGRTPTENDVAAMHAAIRRALLSRLGPGGARVRILYGGSVKPENASALLAVPDVGGALVGGAALDAAGFLRIAAACARG